jgi:anti-sigma-K factor RskA
MNETTMRCEQVEELAGAYALHALPPEELADVEAHLAGCERHPEVAELLAAASALAVVAPEMEPPPALKDRLMAAVRAEASPSPAPSVPQRQRPAADPLAWLKRAFSAPRLGYGLAAAMAAILVAVILSTAGGGDGDGETVVRTFSEGGLSGKVIYIPDEQTAVIEVDGLDPAPEGRTYQVWAITDERPSSLGLMEAPEGGPVAQAMSGITLEDGQVLAVTLEPAGGSLQPTTDPLFAVEI